MVPVEPVMVLVGVPAPVTGPGVPERLCCCGADALACDASMSAGAAWDAGAVVLMLGEAEAKGCAGAAWEGEAAETAGVPGALGVDGEGGGLFCAAALLGEPGVSGASATLLVPALMPPSLPDSECLPDEGAAAAPAAAAGEEEAAAAAAAAAAPLGVLLGAEDMLSLRPAPISPP